MATPQKLIVDCATGTETLVDLTAEEIAQAKLDAENWQKEKAAQEAAEEAKAEAKASALAKLAELGLTEEEAKAIAG